MQNKYGYKGTDSAKIGVWKWLLDLEARKTGSCFHHKKKGELLREVIISGFAKNVRGDRFMHIQNNWRAFTKYANDNMVTAKEAVEETFRANQ